ncbi:virginiamycin B lyase [Actinokineospora baliensis]|uniref:Vgb family protein n=1 Tax=Actinokineospora baliensis TaxID=547056 RepID=UPI00195AB38C|nr:SMP-30/gluconolactonase/LRE family protein [Actinokineospora baliensis]MBM7773948.1 virginiamycin B lyase [Actinokineospora baliensis]
MHRTSRSIAAALVVAALLTPVPASAAYPITEYGPVPSSIPVGGVCEVEFDHTGALWVEQYLSSQVARFDPATGAFTNFSTPMPLSVPGGMDLDLAGDLWMPQVTGNSLLRVDTATGAMTEFPLPWANALNLQPLGIPLHSGLGLANDIALGPDGALWFTLGGLNSIGRYDPATGAWARFPVPGEILGQVGALFGIIKPGPGRTVVFDLPQLNKVATLDVDTHRFTQYTMPTPLSFPVGVRTAADGTIWVAEAVGMKIARINPGTGQITEYPLLGVNGLLTSLLGGLGVGSIGNPLPTPGPIAEASDGNIYFAVSFPVPIGFGNQIARFNPVTHEVRMWSTPSSASYPCDINVHQPGAVWFGLLTSNKIGKLDLAAT